MAKKVQKNAEVAGEVQNNETKENVKVAKKTEKAGNVEKKETSAQEAMAFTMDGANLPAARVEVEQGALAAAMKAVMPVVPPKPTIPAMSNAMIELHGDAMEISAVSMSQTIRVQVPVANPLNLDDKFSVAARKLAQIVNVLKDGRIALCKGEEAATLAQGRSKFNIRLADGASEQLELFDGPDSERMTAGLGAAGEVGLRLERVASCQSTDDGRRQLNGVQVAIGEKETVFRATDGRRAAKSSLEGFGGAEWSGIIPREAVAMLKTLCCEYSECELAVAYGKSGNGGKVEFAFGGKCAFTTRLVDGMFPNMDKVTKDKASLFEVVMPREELMENIKRICMVNPQATLTFGKGVVKFDAVDETGNRANGEMECGGVEMENVTLGLDFSLVMGFLATCGEDEVDWFIDIPAGTSRAMMYEIFDGDAMFMAMGMRG